MLSGRQGRKGNFFSIIRSKNGTLSIMIFFLYIYVLGQSWYNSFLRFHQKTVFYQIKGVYIMSEDTKTKKQKSVKTDIKVFSPDNVEGKVLKNSLVSGILQTILACNPQSKELQQNHADYRSKLDKIFSEVLKTHKMEDVTVFVVTDSETSAEYGTSVAGLYQILDLVPIITVNKFRAGKGGKSAHELEAISL
jgi:hypothetical protein